MVTRFVGDGDAPTLLLLVVLDRDDAGELGDLRLALRPPGLEELDHARETVRDVLSRDSTGVERPHRELGARLADRLGGDDADRLTDLHQTPGREVAAVAQAADPVDRLARGDGADVHLSATRVGQSRERGVVELVALRRDLLAVDL